ncbi:hypothetical protein [Corynebacterium appendicis]|uniref:hypothetical protein n=1 Tax=Corynebacterium appendicis TaxID=163202 RepID=UPI00254C3F6A|nr:hypothetical protein [Corynebacterium appendicis]MDK8626123.1 hypothetical protein [Corynebacterium appendicis]
MKVSRPALDSLASIAIATGSVTMGIPPFRVHAGTHSWPVWKDDMQRSWNTVIGPALLGDDFAGGEDLTPMNSWNANGSNQNAPVTPQAL